MFDPNDKEAPVDEMEDVVVPEDKADPAAPKVIDLDEEDKNEEEFKKLDNKAFAALRREAAEAKKERDQFKKIVDDYTKSRPAAAPVQRPAPVMGKQREMIGGIPVPETKEEWDALARQDWQAAVDLRSIISARRVQEEVKRVDTETRTLDEAKNRVLERHPELADANSEKGKIFLQILDKNPEYLRMSKGPILAMRDMEDELESRGLSREQIFNSNKVNAQAEATRVNRAALTGGGKMTEKQGRTVQLSKDDLEFCKINELDPKAYAKEKLALESNKRGA